MIDAPIFTNCGNCQAWMIAHINDQLHVCKRAHAVPVVMPVVRKGPLGQPEHGVSVIAAYPPTLATDGCFDGIPKGAPANTTAAWPILKPGVNDKGGAK